MTYRSILNALREAHKNEEIEHILADDILNCEEKLEAIWERLQARAEDCALLEFCDNPIPGVIGIGFYDADNTWFYAWDSSRPNEVYDYSCVQRPGGAYIARVERPGACYEEVPLIELYGDLNIGRRFVRGSLILPMAE